MDTHRFDDMVVVLDLDDTLYKEVEYVLSGIRTVTSQLNAIYGSALDTELVDAYLSGNRDVWGLACSILGLPVQAKDTLLWMYRLHQPTIKLHAQVGQWLGRLKQAGAQLAILTDGRAVSQRLKLASLGLSDLPAYISEEHGSEKPSPERFMAIMNRWPAKRYVYIGDNPRKDFVAPNRLGWFTAGLVDNGANIHPQRRDVDGEYAPQCWIDELEHIEAHLRTWTNTVQVDCAA